MEAIRSIQVLNKIFKSKNWVNKDYEEFVFNNFCDLLEVLEPQERQLLIELTERYTWISEGEYGENISDAFNLVPIEKVQAIDKVFLFPIVKPSDETKYKSGQSFIYEMRTPLLKLSKYTGTPFKALKSFEDFNESFVMKDGESLFLVDDYIGAGDTLNACLEEILKNPSIGIHNINIISISCQRDTYQKFQDRGYSIYCPHKVQKGITDYHDQQIVTEKIALMKRIENSIPGAKRFSLGWKESEGIITLKRTPNNTFPLFWKNLKRHGKYYKAPFLRPDNFIE